MGWLLNLDHMMCQPTVGLLGPHPHPHPCPQRLIMLEDKHSKPYPILVELSMYWAALPPYIVYHLLLTYPTLLSSLLYQ